LKRSNRFKRAVLYQPPMPVPGGMVSQSPKAVCDALATGDNEAAPVTFFTDYAKLSPTVIAKFRSDPTSPQRVKLAPTIFQPFYRITGARDRQSGGTGLGLAIADRVIRVHGGTIHAENAAPCGLRIEIALPRSFVLKNGADA
jgi:light-regulated signal transduction histidine kinase (bacteriophytochrome)